MGSCLGGTEPKVNEEELEWDSDKKLYKKTGDFWTIYEYERTIAKGGSCDVLKVKHKATGKTWAAKELHEYKHKVERLFNREVNILQQLGQHENIVAYNQAYRDKRNFFIVTQYLSGGELFDRIVEKAAKHEYSEETCAHQVQQMLSALKHLHDSDIVHRDLKPENFVFETKADNSKLIMIDFGSALVIKDPDYMYKEVCGTPYYMPPEAVRNRKRNKAELMQGDVFAIGVITYIMMSGTPPFGGNRDEEIFARIKQGDYKWPRHVTWSDELKTFIKSCLHASPADRITVEKALYSPWVVGTNVSHEPVDLQILGSLRKFVRTSQLQKNIVNLMVKNVDRKDNDNLKRMFTRLDRDKNNMITEEEIRISLIDDGMYAPEARKQAKNIMKDCDENNDGHINFDEFVRARARNKLSTDVMVLHAVFALLDFNNDNHVDKKELREIFAGIQDDDGGENGAGLEEDDLIQMIDEVDTDNDGRISFAEFMVALGEKNVGKVAGAVRRTIDADNRAKRVHENSSAGPES